MSEPHHSGHPFELRERIVQMEQLLENMEAELNEILGIQEGEDEIKDDQASDDFLSRFADVLASLQEQEKNTIKVPPERWKSIQVKDVVDLEQMNLAELLGLYQTYLTRGDRRDQYRIDDEFETLIDQRRSFLEDFFRQNRLRWYPITVFVQDSPERKAAIATFLVMLDMVFRKALLMKEERSTVYFRKNDHISKDPEPD